MFSLFANKVKDKYENDIDEDDEEYDEEDDEDYEDEEYYEENEDYEDYSHYLNPKNLIFKNSNVSIYKTTARKLIPNVKLWSFQRPINENHVNALEQNLILHNHFIGTFKIVKDKEKNVRLIDGQHRFESIKRRMEKDSKFDIDIIIELYETDHIDSEYTINLFNKANSSLNITETDLPDKIATEIVNKLCEKYNKCEHCKMNFSICKCKKSMNRTEMIVEKKEGKINRPRIDKKDLYLCLKKYIKEMSKKDEDEKIIIQKIYESIEKINCEYGLKKQSKFDKITEKMHDKCISNGLYIGLDKNFEWINQIKY